MPNIIESFFYVKESSHYMFTSVEAFHNGLGKPEEMIISRLILSETWLILIYETYVFQLAYGQHFYGWGGGSGSGCVGRGITVKYVYSGVMEVIKGSFQKQLSKRVGKGKNCSKGERIQIVLPPLAPPPPPPSKKKILIVRVPTSRSGIAKA